MFVAPYTGAWIEILFPFSLSFHLLSHLTQVRGLKFGVVAQVFYAGMSHLTQVRGLKYELNNKIDEATDVAPYTGAWIEIMFSSSNF